jgi:hypothetical protein
MLREGFDLDAKPDRYGTGKHYFRKSVELVYLASYQVIK